MEGAAKPNVNRPEMILACIRTVDVHIEKTLEEIKRLEVHLAALHVERATMVADLNSRLQPPVPPKRHTPNVRVVATGGKDTSKKRERVRGWTYHALCYLMDRGTGALLEDIHVYCKGQLRAGLLKTSIRQFDPTTIKANISQALNAAKGQGLVTNEGPSRPWKLTEKGRKYLREG